MRTLKAKILLLTLGMLLVLCILMSSITLGAFNLNKSLQKEGCDLMVAYFAERINKSIRQLQTNAQDLALAGEIFYKAKNYNHSLADLLVRKNFQKDLLAAGGGIWFEPYKINPEQKRFCTYGFRINDKIKIDRSFETEKYDYLTQDWYTTIKKGTEEGKSVVWSAPYYDDTGTHSLMTTIGAGIYDENENFIGMSTVDWVLSSIIEKIETIRPTKSSFALFADKENDYILALTDNSLEESNYIGHSLSDISWYKSYRINQEIIEYNGVTYVSFKRNLDNNKMVLIVNVPENELYAELTKRVQTVLTLLISMCFIIAASLFAILNRNVTKPIDYLMDTAEDIGGGNLDAEIKIEKPEEFARLAKSFNQMTKDIKEHVIEINTINLEKHRMQAELDIAKSIQLSALPSVFPPYPERHEFDIFAKMETAKDVGGDFYDFFFVDKEHFVFLIADVSGKGVPAALFMMTVKTMIKSLAKSGLSAGEIATIANKKICKTNKEGLFVTMFLCIIDLTNGKIDYVNAGHNPPLIMRRNGKFEYFKTKPNLVIGAMSDIDYEVHHTKLNAGDCALLYTDGVTEAFNEKEELYGEDNLYKCLNDLPHKDRQVDKIILTTRQSVADFAHGAEQSDDMTMLAFKYNGADVCAIDKNSAKIKTFLLPAKVERFDSVLKWLDDICNDEGIADVYKGKLNLAFEEIFVNISSYAYPPKEGDVEIRFRINDNSIIEIEFIDGGMPYNPLEKPDPDITLGIEARPVGGLGIFMVKKLMDEVLYEYKDGKNILTLKLNFKK